MIINYRLIELITDCPCAGEKPANLEAENDEGSEPVATNGEVQYFQFIIRLTCSFAKAFSIVL